ncbi:MAG: hypothetical protein ACE5HB_01850, partial [Terriglobia bacterium]
MKNVRIVVFGLVLFLVPGVTVLAQEEAAPKTIAEFTRGMECQPGFLPLCWDARQGKLYLEVGRLD